MERDAKGEIYNADTIKSTQCCRVPEGSLFLSSVFRAFCDLHVGLEKLYLQGGDIFFLYFHMSDSIRGWTFSFSGASHYIEY